MCEGKAGVAGQWTSVRIVNLKDEEQEAAAASVKFNAGPRLQPHPPAVFATEILNPKPAHLCIL